MGSLAAKKSEPLEGDEVQGVLVTHNFTSKIVKPDDLATYTPLRTGSISSKLHVPFAGSIETLRLFITEMFANVTESENENDGKVCTKFSLHGNKVTVTLGMNEGVAVVKWEASPAGDVIADALVALIMHAQSSAASIRLTSKPCRHPRANEEEEPESKKSRMDESLTENRLRLIKDTLLDQFENVEVVYEGNMATYEIKTDTGLDTGIIQEEEEPLICTAKVSFQDSNGGNAEILVECVDKKLASNVQVCLQNLARGLAPLES
jgi:cleavage and polyadenylation specificity factor subunit 3